VGKKEGFSVGLGEGSKNVGALDGPEDGSGEGAWVGCAVGREDGDKDGCSVEEILSLATVAFAPSTKKEPFPGARWSHSQVTLVEV
jgi:hypothetical protein